MYKETLEHILSTREIFFGAISFFIYTFILTFGSLLHRIVKGPKVIDDE